MEDDELNPILSDKSEHMSYRSVVVILSADSRR